MDRSDDELPRQRLSNISIENTLHTCCILSKYHLFLNIPVDQMNF